MGVLVVSRRGLVEAGAGEVRQAAHALRPGGSRERPGGSLVPACLGWLHTVEADNLERAHSGGWRHPPGHQPQLLVMELAGVPLVESVQRVAGFAQVFVSLKLGDISGSRQLVLLLLAVSRLVRIKK